MSNNQQQPPPLAVAVDVDEDKDPCFRRPRGRPTGSRNRPKPPIIINRDSPNTLRAHLFDISPGADISSALSNFAHRRERCLSILTATGTVANVTLRQPSTSPAVLHGCFQILSLSGAFFSSSPHSISSLAVYLSGGQGQVIGGSVVGSLIAAGPVRIIAATFANAPLEHLPLTDTDDTPPPSGELPSPPPLLPFINLPRNLLNNNNNNNNNMQSLGSFSKFEF